MNRTPRLLALIGFAVPACALYAADAEVQRQLQLRDQQQMELRLKMQQQVDRTQRPSGGASVPGSESRRHLLERDQQQRLQILHEQQMRSAIPNSQTPADIERQRALNASGAELRRSEVERAAQVPPSSPAPQ